MAWCCGFVGIQGRMSYSEFRTWQGVKQLKRAASFGDQIRVPKSKTRYLKPPELAIYNFTRINTDNPRIHSKLGCPIFRQPRLSYCSWQTQSYPYCIAIIIVPLYPDCGWFYTLIYHHLSWLSCLHYTIIVTMYYYLLNTF
jgi:hypothetical protein